jgi:succinate-acetate transporter protein
VPVSEFAGIFALMTVPTSYGQFWVTISLNTLEPEADARDDEEGAWV